MDGSLCTTRSAMPAVEFRADPTPLSIRLSQSAVRAIDRLFTWQDRARSRRALLQMDDRMLRDIGVDRLDAQQEATQLFWRP